MTGSLGSPATWWWLSVVVLVGAGAVALRREPPARAGVRRYRTGARQGAALLGVGLAAVVYSLTLPVDA